GANAISRGHLIILAIVLLAACERSPGLERPAVDTTDTRGKAILELVDELPPLTRFARALEMTGYRDVLDGTGPFTVFAPVNDGFLRSGIDSAFLANRQDTLRAIVGLHIMRGDLDTLWRDSTVVSSISQSTVTLRTGRDKLLVDGRPIIDRFI